MTKSTIAIRVDPGFHAEVRAAAKAVGETQGQFVERVLRAAVSGESPDPAPEPEEPAPTPHAASVGPTSTRMTRRPDGHCKVLHPTTGDVEITGDEARCLELAESRWPGIEVRIEDVPTITTTKTRRAA